MKKLLSVILSVIFALTIICMCTSVYAEATLPRLVDQAKLLSDDEYVELLSKLDETSKKQQFDVVIITLDTLEGSDIMDTADDIFDYYGFGIGEERDGCLLLLDMESRKWWISTRGFGITAFTDDGIAYIGEQLVPYLKDGDYVDGFDEFVNLCDDFVTKAKDGKPYDKKSLPHDIDWFKWIGLALAIGLISAFIPVMIMKSKLTTVSMQNSANNYVRNDSLDIQKSRDTYLYSTISKTRKESKSSGSSTHSSSSGATHGGGGGSF